MAADLTQQLLELTQQRRFDEVVSVWRAAAVAQRDAEMPKRLAAAAYAQSGNLNAAFELLQELVSRETLEAATAALAGRVFFDVGRPELSLHAWERAMKLVPDNPIWWRWFAEATIRANQPERALRGAEVLTLHRENNLDVALAYVTLLAKAQRAQEALVAFERMLVRWPDHAIVGPAFAQFVMREFPLEARELMARRAWCPQPDALSPERVRAALWLPPFFESEAAAGEWRNHLLAQIHRLTELAVQSPLQRIERASCLSMTPYFAAFHDADITAIQFAWGDFVEALLAPLRTVLPAVKEREHRVRRVGIVSNRLTDSSAGRFFNDWVPQLISAGFEVRLYAIGRSDAETDRLSRLAPTCRVAEDDERHGLALAQQILTDSNDVLLFPEPQGSPLTMQVAGLRCAPIQIAAFGNPVTTGLHTMDYFVVPDAAEVDSPHPYYRERVVRLDGIGVKRPAALPVSEASRESYGLRPDERIYLVNQQMQKWTPTFVDSVAEILRNDRNGRLVYFGVGASVSARAEQIYVRGAFAAHGIDVAERMLRITELNRSDFMALNRWADVSLDTFGYGGGSTTMDALAVGLPVVTLQGAYLRSRQTAGMLRSFGCNSLIASNRSQFVELALAIANKCGPTLPRLADQTDSTGAPTRTGDSGVSHPDVAHFLQSLNAG